MVERCAYYVSASAGVLRMELRALDLAGPYRLIVDGDTDRHIEYFADPGEALHRWAEFENVMRPDLVSEDDFLPAIH